MDSRYYDKARRRVEEKKKFNKHLQSYLTTNLIMFAMGFVLRFWRGWIIAAFFWGIGLLFHYIKAYGFPGMEEDDDWEEKEIEREVKKMKARDRYKYDREPPHRTNRGQEDDFDIDDYLDLDQPRPMPRKKYDEEDLV